MTLSDTEMKMDIILLGAPGSGKGTQAELLQSRLGLTHIASGDLFRENINEQTDLGKLAKVYIDQGHLVPDEVTINMIRNRLLNPDAAHGLLFDGFPRTIPQAEAMDELVATLGRKIDFVINLTVSDPELLRRLSGRLICRECQVPFHRDFNQFDTCPLGKCSGECIYQREDDKPLTVLARLEVFHKQTTPLIKYYEEKGNLVTMSGEGAVESVYNQILHAILLDD